MSKAVELAKLHGIDPDAAEQQAVVIVLESFYHAARAEMANEIIAEWEAPYSNGQAKFIDRLRAMADRDGK